MGARRRCNVEPRTAFPYFRSVPWRKREDKTDASIWAVPCFITRAGSVTAASAMGSRTRPSTLRASVDPRSGGLSDHLGAGKEVPWGELNVGHVYIFAAAGFAEVSRPTLRRAVYRIDFER